MDQRLVEAARLGDVVGLHALLEEDPQILEKVDLSPVAGTPLHIAALAGKIDFVKEMLQRMPSFAREPNQDGFSPMHMAAARGHIDVMRELLDMDESLCLVKDRGTRTPLHYAAIKGRVNIIKEMLDHCPRAVEQVTARGETVLHLAVHNYQFQALKVFVQWLKNSGHGELINAQDEDGNTISELAISTKQLQVINLLNELRKEEIMEIVSGDHVDGGTDMVSQTDLGIKISDRKSSEETSQSTETKSEKVESSEVEEKDKKTKRKYEKLILVVASLIATVTFQAGLTPPQSIWKEGMELDWDCLSDFGASSSISEFFNFMKTCRVIPYIIFMSFNTTGFSCAILFLGLSLKNPVFVKILLAISLVAMFLAYFTFSITMSPDSLSFLLIYVITIFIFIHYILVSKISYIFYKKLQHVATTRHLRSLKSLVSNKFRSSLADVSRTDAQRAPSFTNL